MDVDVDMKLDMDMDMDMEVHIATRHTASPSVRTLPYNKTRNERAESLRPTVGRYS
jgi:hypothetical protein